MIGVLITAAFALGWMGIGRSLADRFLSERDAALAAGVSGLLGLGFAGLVTFPIGIMPSGFRWGVFIVALIAAAGWIRLLRGLPRLKFGIPPGVGGALWGGTLLAVLFALAGVIAPSTSLDWDSLAYHLAIPKIWLAAGQIERIGFIHHSNFPFVVDNLFVWGELWGGASGAKAFSLAFLVFGCLAIYGLARERYGSHAGGWAALCFATVPVVLWESGTAYIDVAHGLFAGLGAALLLDDRRERGWWVIPALFLGFAIGSKYTGIGSYLAAGLVLIIGSIGPRAVKTPAYLVACAAFVPLLVGMPWYVKNAVWTGNPVFPFFYERLGGQNWSDFNAKIYREEQQTFGVPGLSNAPSAIAGLAYQPGRYNNPSPKLVVTPQGASGAQGFPTGAIGVALWVAGLAWLFSGRGRSIEGRWLAWIGVSLVLWLGLSQQSRYIVSLAPILAVLAGGAVVRLRAGPLVAGVIGLNGLYTLYMLHTATVADQLKVALGQESPTDYQKRRVPFYNPAQRLNELAKGGKVALYDEVFGYLLDVPYLWANPGHTTEYGYEAMNSGDELAERLKELGVTHVYLSLLFQDPSFKERWLKAMGANGPAEPFSAEEAAGLDADLRTKWKRLLAEAVASGKLRPVESGSNMAIFELQR